MAKEGRLESYPWYPSDWRSDPAVVLMSASDRGVYRDVLDLIWEHGSIANDPELIRRMACIQSSDWEASWPQVQGMFAVIDGQLRHGKVDKRRPKCLEMKQLRSDAGKIGGQASVQSKVQAKLKQSLSKRSTIVQPELKQTFNDRSTIAQAKVNLTLALAPALTLAPALEPSLRSGCDRGVFVSDIEGFKVEYPTSVNQLAEQYFTLCASTAFDQETLFRNLGLWKGTDQWVRGFVPKAENWLKNGDWKIAPKEAPKAATGKLGETLQWLANRGKTENDESNQRTLGSGARATVDAEILPDGPDATKGYRVVSGKDVRQR